MCSNVSAMQITIDPKSGFCFGVEQAIGRAGEVLAERGKLYCLGEIVHNQEEVKRLENQGMQTIDRKQLAGLHNAAVLIRAHGEPPETYQTARRNKLELIEGTCPVVLKLQKRVASLCAASSPKQIIIFGKHGHAEVEGLTGQCPEKTSVLQDEKDWGNIDFTVSTALFSQTTRSIKDFHAWAARIKAEMAPHFPGQAVPLSVHDTICREVAHRDQELRSFAAQHDKIVFVSGKNSSNGRMLFQVCRRQNPESYFVSTPGELPLAQFSHAGPVGVCGATSTPRWLMEEVAEALRKNYP